MKHAGRLTINGGADNSPARPVRVFCAYSRRDQSYREELVTYLSGLERDGLISIWFDRMISPGIDWNREIAAELDSAEIILLLLSADFVKSAYCVGVEMKRAQERAHRKEIRAVPIFIRPYYWPGSPLHAFQGLPSNGKPVKKWKDREDAYVEIARGIEIVAAEIRKPAATRTNIGSAESPILSGFSSVKFDNRDMLGWMGSMFTWWRKLSKYAWQEPDPVPTALPDKSRVALFGCWGTGLYGAPVVSKSISSDPRGYQLLLHLGNTYYSGTASEIRDQLIAPWPRVPGAVSRALCGNHEMYTGGTAYIEAVQNEFGQMSSAFAFQNDHWILACLDTAYDDNDLYGNQAVWLENLLNRAGGRRLILVSHHFPFSQFEPPSPKLVAKLIPWLRSRMIFAWYWAHEHICALYEPHPLWGFLGRCAGHGGFPYLRLRLPGSRPEDTQFIRVASKALIPAADVLDGPNPYVTGSETAYGPHGFLSLEFDGPKLVERVHSAEGNVLREQVLA